MPREISLQGISSHPAQTCCLLRGAREAFAAVMAVKVVELKRIAYDSALVPNEGSEVCCALAAPAKHSNKDPAGHAFHAFALRQAGHVGAYYS